MSAWTLAVQATESGVAVRCLPYRAHPIVRSIEVFRSGIARLFLRIEWAASGINPCGAVLDRRAERIEQVYVDAVCCRGENAEWFNRSITLIAALT